MAWIEGNGMETMVVTGASSGVGRALALHFAAKGMTVCALARREGKLRELQEQHPENIEPYPTDVSDASQVKDTFAAILAAHPQIDVLINNAGVLNRAQFGDEDFEVIDRVIDTNLKGTMYCTYAVLPAMMARGRGRIINISSTAGIPGEHIGPEAGIVRFGDYAASKFGVVGFGDLIARDLRHYGILLTTLCPGGIRTPIWEKDGENVYRGDPDDLMAPEEIADLVEFLLDQPDRTLYKTVVFFPTCEWH